MAKNLKKNLMAVNKKIKALSKKIEKMTVAVDKLERAKATKKTKSKIVKKAPVKKKVAKAKPAVKKAAQKKAQQATAADSVFGFIKRSKKGINTETLVAKTGFDHKKIANIIYRLKKSGKIQNPKKGVYVSA